MTTDHKAIVTRWFEEVWNQGRQRTIDEVVAPNCLTKVEGIDAPLTRDDFKQYQVALLSAVPDLLAAVPLIVAEAGKVIATRRARGTHLGRGLGICDRNMLKLAVNRRQDVAQALGKIPGSVLNRHGDDIKA